MSRKRLLGLMSLFVGTALMLSACTGGLTPTGEQKAGPPDVGGEMIYEVPADPDTFAYYWASSAYATTVTDKVFGEGLLRFNKELKPTPFLAEDMPKITADGKTYTFKLRKGIKFHDGTEVKAQDIAFAYEILMDPDYLGRSKSTVSQLESVKVLDDYTVEFKTKEVFAPFMFTVPYLAPIPKARLAGVPVKDMASHDFWKQPIGAGPFTFVEWKPGQYTLLERFDGYWANGKEGFDGYTTGPWVEKIRIRVIPEDNTAIAALEAGELTYMDSVEPSQVDRLKTDFKDRLTAYDWNRLGYGYQTFNNDLFPTNIKEVRQALSYGLNREAIIQGVMDNKAVIPPGFVPPIHWTFDKSIKGYGYDPKKAEELIQTAGFRKNAQGVYEKDGQPLKITYVGTKGSPIIEGIALASKKDWGAIGVDVELLLVDFNTLLDRHMKPGNFNVVFSGLGFSVDPHTSFFSGYHSSNIRLDDKGVNQGSNTARYNNPKVDELIDKGMTTVDINERLKIYQQAQRLIVDDAPANWIYVNVWTDFVRKDVKGVTNWDGFGVMYMEQWYMRER